MNDSTNQPNGASQDKGAQPNAPEHKGDKGAQQEQKQDAPKQDGEKQADDKSSSPS